MLRNLLLLTAITIVLVLTAVLSGIYFKPTIEQPTSTQSDIAVVDPVPDLYSFGDDDKYAVLLHMAAAQVRPENAVILTAAASTEFVPEETICTHTGVSVAVPPAGVLQSSLGQENNHTTIWHRVSNWVAASFQDNYVVTLWVPDSPQDSFTLVSGDAPASPVVCSQAVDEDV